MSKRVGPALMSKSHVPREAAEDASLRLNPRLHPQRVMEMLPSPEAMCLASDRAYVASGTARFPVNGFEVYRGDN